MTKKYIISSMVSVLIMMIGVSIAYFQARIVGEGNNMSISIKELKIVFTDSPALTANNVGTGWNTSKTFTVENLSEATYQYNIVLKNLVNTIKTYGSLEYKIESTNSGYNTNNEWIDVPKSYGGMDVPIAFSVSIADGVTQSYTIYFRYADNGEDQRADLGKTFTGSIGIEEATNPTLVSKLLEINQTRLTRTNFDTALETENTGTLYTTTNTEDGSRVYYFAGNALNNWVKFGKCTSADYNCTVGDDLYWRIIRTNETIEDGGIRLLYAGSGSVANQNAYIDDGTYWSGSSSLNNNDPLYVGYMWGTTGSLENNRTNQTIHSNTPAEKISSWYTATFNNSNDNKTKDLSGQLLTNYISPTAIYCNDRSVGYGSYNTVGTSMFFGSRERISTDGSESTINPSLACGATSSGYENYFEGGTTGDLADKFTGSTTNASGTTIGNGLLTNSPAALITADELNMAGEVNAWYVFNAASTPSNITGENMWWTMSSNGIGSLGASVRTARNGSSAQRVNNSWFIRPVISLKANVLWSSGNGSPSNPFEVILSN